MSSDPPEDPDREAAGSASFGELVDLLRDLDDRLGYPPVGLSDDEWAGALDAAGDFVVRAGGQPPASGRFRDRPDSLHELGRALLGLGRPGLAATVLLRAHELGPDDREIGIATTSALLAVGDPRRADAVAREGRIAEVDTVGWYLASFAAIASADLDAARYYMARTPETTSRPEDLLVRRIRTIIDRVAELAGTDRLDGGDVRGWNYVLTGGLLLVRSPFGPHMHGRFGYLRDTVERCRLSVDRLESVLLHLGVEIPRVVAPADPDSRILAGALAGRLGVAVNGVTTAGSDEPGLMVLYALAGQPANLTRALRRHSPRRPLWIHAANWTRDEAVAGDVTSVLVQSIRPVWREEPDQRPVDVDAWTAKILGATPPADAGDRDDLLRLLDQLAERGRSGLSLLRDDGERSKQWVASPVSSPRL